ncbi:MAG: GvpL/GvpF family gas vesicle protein, partial [Acidobacteriota bacterium]|nr:GvpL/GvpF family gas vesicle protein [Acidobacteriota bacterium]
MTVLYCLVQSSRTAVSAPAGGLPGAGRPRAVPLEGGLTAIVATLPDHLYAPDVVNEKLRDMNWVSEAAIGHEGVLETIMKTGATVLPMKLLTLFSGDARMTSELARQRKALLAAATRVAGCEEYGLRVAPIDASPAARAADRPASGLAFLERKKQVRDDARERSALR